MAQWLVFDVGETLASEERWLGSWADWLGVRRGTFFAALTVNLRSNDQEPWSIAGRKGR